MGGLGAVFEVLSAISGIATAVVILPIVKRVSESIALGYIASRILESTVVVLVNVGQSLVSFHDPTFLLGPQFCSGLGTGLLLG